jgi:hypothetical protein
MTDPALEAAVRETYEAWNSGDPEPLIRIMHPDMSREEASELVRA